MKRAAPEILDPMGDEARGDLEALHPRLLKLHKTLLDHERVQYEKLFGKVTSQVLLQLLLSDQWFAWLRPLSQLIVRIDEALDKGSATGTATEAIAILDYTNGLLRASEKGNLFASSYFTALQGEPAVVMAHAEVRKILKKK